MTLPPLSLLARVLVPATVLAVALAGPASAASWTTVVKAGGARSQACKVSVQDGRAWRLYVRLVNNEDVRFESTYSVSQGGRTVDQAKLAARAGQTSAVKSVVIRRDGTQKLGAGISGDGGGLGDSDIQLSGIGRC